MKYLEVMATKITPTPGTKVLVRFGGRLTPAVLIENRGVFHGVNIVRVRLGDGSDPDALDFELPLDELEPAPLAAA